MNSAISRLLSQVLQREATIHRAGRRRLQWVCDEGDDLAAGSLALPSGVGAHHRPGSSTFGIRRSNGVEQIDELHDVARGERCDRLFIGVIYQGIDFVEQSNTLGGRITHDLSAIGKRALAADVTRLLELIEDASNRGSLLDHALADGER